MVQKTVGLLAVSMVAAHAFAQAAPAPNSSGAIVLPEVSLPAVPTSGQATPPVLPGAGVGVPTPAPGQQQGAAAAAPTVEAPAAAGKVFSFGTAQFSLLFMPNQISRMKDAIVAYESGEVSTGGPAPVVQDVAPVAEVTNEPPEYPVFFLTSIVYEKPGDWSIWLGGHKITSRKNNTDLTILSVSRESVTFSWAPDYAKFIERRRKEGLIAKTDEVKHKLATQQAISSDDLGAITFTLRQNQSFAVGYYSVFEGYIDSPQLVPLVVDQAAADGSMSMPGEPSVNNGVAPPLPGMPGAGAPPSPSAPPAPRTPAPPKPGAPVPPNTP